MPATDSARSTTAPVAGAIPTPRTADAAHRHDGHRHPADLSEAEMDLVDSVHDMYPEAAFALEDCHCFHAAGPHHPDDHARSRE